MTRLLPVAILLLGFSLNMSYAQETPLKLNKSHEESLTLGEQHYYTIKAPAEKFIVAKVMQKGIDLVVNLYDPQGEQVGTFDSPNFQNGPEFVTFESDEAGVYKLEVIGLEENQDPGHSGDYSVELMRIDRIPTTPAERIDQLFIPWDLKGSPGASVAVMKKGKVVFSKGYGEAQLEYGIPIEPKTIFHIASVSKQFTAFCMAKLADDGKLSLDDPIQKHIPEIQDFGKEITIKHLIHHTSGMRDQWNLLAMAGWRLDDVITKDQVMRLMSRQTALNFDPGAEYLYCNSGYTLMAEIVERVTDMPFDEWTAKNIFEPLGMENTLFYTDHEKIVPNRSYSYGEGPEGFQKSVLSYANAGATSLFTTPEDLLQWAHNFSNPRVGNAMIMDQMHEQGVLTNGDTISYAFGQVIGEWRGLKTISHGGADAGYRTQLLRFPEQEVNIVVFSNLGSFNPGGKAYEIAEIYLDEYLEEEPESGALESTAEEETEDGVAVSQDLLDEYTGEYQLAPGFIITVSNEDGNLLAQATGQGQFQMTPTSEVEFTFAQAGIRIVFERGDNKKVNQFTLYQGGQEMVCKRLGTFDEESIDL
ncbi:MAG: serine hydrolase, partial [Bacteroidota bacterium]